MPFAPSFASRGVARSLLGLLTLAPVLAACSDPAPRYRALTADAWIDRLLDPDEDVSRDAANNLERLKESAPAEVTAALVSRLSLPPARGTSTPLTFTYDAEEAAAFGLPRTPGRGAMAEDLLVLRRRIAALGFRTAEYRASDPLTIEALLPTGLTREEAERVGDLLARRGAFALRVVYAHPAPPQRPGARPRPWSGERPFAEVVASERALRDAATAARGPYRAAEPGVRLVAQVAGRGTVEGEYLLVEDPPAGTEGIDDGTVVGATSLVAPDGRPSVDLHVDPARLDRVRAFVDARRGEALALVIDDVAIAVVAIPLPATGPVLPDGRLRLDLWDTASVASRRDAADLAVVLSGSRHPAPLFAAPLPEAFGRDPSADNVLTRMLLRIGPSVLPSMERLAEAGPTPFSRVAAKWVIDRYRESGS